MTQETQQIAVLPKGSPEVLAAGRVYDPEAIERRRLIYMGMLEQILELGDTAIPAGYDHQDKERRRLQVISAINYGAEVGLAPYNAIRAVYFPNGRPALHSDGPGTVAEASGQLEESWQDILVHAQIKAIADGGPVLGMFPEKLRAPLQFWALGMMSRAVEDRNYRCAVALAWRRGRAIPNIRWFDTIWAATSGLLDKRPRGKDGPWQLYTDRMLRARATTYALRDTIPEAFQGMYLEDEMAEIVARERGELGAAAPPSDGLKAVIDAAAAPVAEDEVIRKNQIRARVRALLAKKFAGGARGQAVQVAMVELGLVGDPDNLTANQWDALGSFLDEMSPQDRRLKVAGSEGDPPAA